MKTPKGLDKFKFELLKIWKKVFNKLPTIEFLSSSPFSQDQPSLLINNCIVVYPVQSGVPTTGGYLPGNQYKVDIVLGTKKDGEAELSPLVNWPAPKKDAITTIIEYAARSAVVEYYDNLALEKQKKADLDGQKKKSSEA